MVLPRIVENLSTREICQKMLLLAVIDYLVIEFRVVIFSSAQVEYQIVFAVFVFDEFCHLFSE